MSEPRTPISAFDPDLPGRSNHSLGTGGVRMAATEELFAWRGDAVVLLVEPAPASFVVARGWVYGDRLVDIRRWSFANPAGLAGQVRRLVRDATGNHTAAEDAAATALVWAREHFADRA